MSNYAYKVEDLGPYRVDPLEHIGLARSIASKYRCYGLTAEDIQQEALTVLCTAARNFDPSLGFRFNTWAGKLITSHLVGVIYLYRRMGQIGNRNLRCPPKAYRKHLQKIEPEVDPETIRELLRGGHWGDNPSDWACSVTARHYSEREVSLDRVSEKEEPEDPAILQTLLDGESAADTARILRLARETMNAQEMDLLDSNIVPGLTVRDSEPTQESLALRWGVTRQRVQQVDAVVRTKIRLAIAKLTSADQTAPSPEDSPPRA